MSVLPFFEEGMEELFKKHSANGNLLFFHYIEEVIDQCEILMITVGTPSLPNGEADLSYVEEAARQIGRSMNEYKAIVIKSTVPVGTGDKINKIIKTELKKETKKFLSILFRTQNFYEKERHCKMLCILSGLSLAVKPKKPGR